MKGCVAAVLLDDAQMRVTRYDFAPGGETGWHRHEMDYLIVTVTTCNFAVDTEDGQTAESTRGPGEAYRRPVGTRHNVRNNGSAPMAFIEVELKH